MRFALWRCPCVLCRIGGNRREACQSGRMGLTANELSPSKATGGSNPLASATQLNSSTQAPVAQRIEHLTTDQKVRGSNPFGRAVLKPSLTRLFRLSGSRQPLCQL